MLEQLTLSIDAMRGGMKGGWGEVEVCTHYNLHIVTLEIGCSLNCGL